MPEIGAHGRVAGAAHEPQRRGVLWTESDVGVGASEFRACDTGPRSSVGQVGCVDCDGCAATLAAQSRAGRHTAAQRSYGAYSARAPQLWSWSPAARLAHNPGHSPVSGSAHPKDVSIRGMPARCHLREGYYQRGGERHSKEMLCALTYISSLIRTPDIT